MSDYSSPLSGSVADRLRDSDPGIRRVAVLDLVDSPEEEAVGLLIAALGDKDETVRMEAARMIDEFEPRDMMSALVGALTSEDQNVRNAAANALADLKDDDAAPALIEALQESDPFVLASILRSLKQLRLREARPHALHFLNHPDASVRREAVGVLGYLQENDNLPQLISIAGADADPEVRRAAIGTLVYADPSQVTKALINGLSDANWLVRSEAAKSIGRLGIVAAVDSLMDAVTDDAMWQVQEKSAEALGKIGSAAALPALAKCASNPISNLRKAAVAATGEIARPEGMPIVEEALNDNDPDVRKLARWAKAKIESNVTSVGG